MTVRLLALITATAYGSAAFADATYIDRSQGRVRVDVLETGLTIHTYLSKGLPGGLGSVNSHIFETDDAVMIVDTQFYRAAAEDVRAYVEGLGKPVERIIISHAHPDHGFGYSYMSDLAPASGTAETIAEAAGAFPFFASAMVERMGQEAAAANFPLDDIPQITETLAEGSFTFGPTEIEVFVLPSHEAGTQTFIGLPKHGMLWVFDAIMPNAHQLVFGQPGAAFEDRLHTGKHLIDDLAGRETYDTLVFGHNSIEPLPKDEQLANAREGLRIYGELAKTAESPEAFIAGAAEVKPDWGQFYVPMTTSAVFSE